jgi:hypothetical protein
MYGVNVMIKREREEVEKGESEKKCFSSSFNVFHFEKSLQFKEDHIFLVRHIPRKAYVPRKENFKPLQPLGRYEVQSYQEVLSESSFPFS